MSACNRKSSERLRRLLAALTLVFLAASPHAQAPPPIGSGLIAGQVVDADTGRGVPGAAVALIGVGAAPGGDGGATSATRRGAVYTDLQGRFYFSSLAAGNYAAESQLAGYTSLTPTRMFELADGARKMDLKFVLRKRGSIAGVVRDDTGDPVVGVEVLALRRSTAQGRPPALVTVARHKTDDRGVYRLTGLDVGSYLICACNRDPLPLDGLLLTTIAARPFDLLAVAGRAAQAGADAATLEGPQRTLPPTFHPNTTLAARAQRVTLVGGESKTAVDIEMITTTAARVSGRIVGAPGTVNAGFLRLRPVGDVPEAAALTQMMPMLVQPDGRFDFANVPPGDYVLEVDFRPGQRGGGPSGSALAFLGGRGAAMAPTPAPPVARGGGPPDPANDPLWSAQPITVGDRDVTDLVIALNRGLVVSGRMEFLGAIPPPTAQVLSRAFVQLTSLELTGGARTFTGYSQPDGTYQIRGIVPGRYIMSPDVQSPGWQTLRSISAGGRNVTDEVLDIAEDLTNVALTFTDAPMATISGRVVSPGDAVDTFVRAFPVDKKYWREPFGAFRRFRSVRINADNTYAITRVPAGEYFVVVAMGVGTDWMDTVTLESLSRGAERIRVADGEKAVVEVRR